MGEVIVSYEVNKSSKMGLDHDGYLWVEDEYSGDERGECGIYQKHLSWRNPDMGKG